VLPGILKLVEGVLKLMESTPELPASINECLMTEALPHLDLNDPVR
jgi:hypothetical protein